MTFKLDLKQTETLQMAAEYTEANLRTYSGRGMYGKQCIGLVHEGPDELIGFIIEAFRAFQSDFNLHQIRHMFSGTRQDSMGLGVVTYWPSLTADQESYDYLDWFEEAEEEDDPGHY